MSNPMVKIEFTPCTRTDLLCIYCGMFHTDYAVRPQGDTPIDWEPQAGIHAKCIPLLHVKRGTK